jgi:hypothetical protein
MANGEHHEEWSAATAAGLPDPLLQIQETGNGR